jgi:hypothetical protein
MQKRPLGGTLAAAAMAVASLLGCGTGSSESTYFPTAGETSLGVPALAGQAAYFGIETLTASAGDHITLDSLEVVGPKGDVHVTGLAAVLGLSTSTIGAATEADLIASGFDLSPYRAVNGFTFAAGDGPVALAVRIEGGTATAGFASVRLRFEVNDGTVVTETFNVSGLRCVADTIEAGAAACHAALSS